MNPLKRLWPDLIVVVGAALLLWGLTSFTVRPTGQMDYGRSTRGDFSTHARIQATLGAAMIAAGLLARRNTR